VGIFHRLFGNANMVTQACHTILIVSAFWIDMPYARGDWLMGLSYYQQGKYRKAVHELSAEIKDNSEDVLLNRILGLSYYQLKDYSKAEIFLRKVGALQPDFQVALELAQVYVRRSDYGEALQTLEESRGLIRTKQERFQFHYVFGSVLMVQGVLSKARSHFKKAELFAEKAPRLYFQIGTLEYNQGNLPAALMSLERSLEIDSRQPQVMISLGEVYLRLSSTQFPPKEKAYLNRAVSLAKETLQLNRDSVEGHSLAGRAYLGLRNFTKAAKEFRRVLVLDKSQPSILYSLGQALIGLNRYQEGARVLEQASKESPEDATIFYALGFCQEKVGLTLKALNAYKRAQQLGPASKYAASVTRLEKN